MIHSKSLYNENDSDSMEDCRSYEGLTCTCSKDDILSSNTTLTTKKLLYIPFGNYKKFNSSQISSKEQSSQKVHNGTVSLSQILDDKRKEDVADNPLTRRELSHSYSSPFISSLYQHQRQPKDLTSSGSSRYGSPDASPEGFDQPNSIYRRTEGERKLTPFERDNILYIQELKEKQREALQNLEKQVQDLPNFNIRQRNHYNESILYDKYSLDEKAPRGGSPFPRRREYPLTAFSPSKTATSKALRSLSLEEEAEEEDLLACKKEDNRYHSHNVIWSKSNDSCYNPRGNGGGRKLWATPYSDSHSFNAWWTNLPPSPNSMSPLNSPSFRRKSASSIASYSKSSAPAQFRTGSTNPTNDDPSLAKRTFSYRSFSSPATSGDRKAFDPQDLSLSFVNFEELRKCRPELEDVGGHVGSILSTSSSEEIIPKRTMLPPTVEVNQENFSDEDTARKNQQQEAKVHQNGEPIQKSTIHSNPSNTPSIPLPATTTEQKPSTPPLQSFQSTQNDTTHTNPPKTPTTEGKKALPMAFTVDFESVNSDSSTSGNSAKKLEIAASISQWAPKHRRNLSLTKVDEHKKVEERQGSEKPPLGRPRSGTVGAGPSGSKRGGAGYHSEGYFSSDQDDEGPKRTDLKSPRSPRTPDTVQAQPMLVRSNSHDSSKGASLRMRPPSPLSPTSPYGTPLNETASFLIEKMMNATPETRRKFSNKPEGRTCCKERERKPSVSELTGKTYRTDKKMGSDGKKQVKNAPVDDFDNSKDEKDDVSEAGTYTIDKDSPTPEEDQARNDIDGVFGVTTESEAEMTSTTTTAVPMSTTDQCQEDESSWLSASEIPPSISRNSPNWIQQWAAHVAEQTKPPINLVSPLVKSSVTSPRGHKLPLASQENNDSRPRRKLPTPPSHLSTTPTGLSQRSDPVSSKHRLWHDPTYSDLTSDTEGYLRDTENIVTSLQARVDKTKGANPAFRNTSFESHESGGDSDFDTSTSYPFNDDERMSASLKSKLRLTGLMPQSKCITSPSAGITSPRRPDGGANLDPKHKSRDPSYDMYNSRREERGLHSDSSSEASEPYKDVIRTTDNNPPLKFNRAFSLRRARLGCDDHASTSSLDKKKANRTSSAGTIGSTRKGALGTAKPYQSVDSASVSSPRSYGYGSPRGIASPSQNVGGSKGTPQSDNFDRTDGGRYSLRLPRSGSSTIGLAKSPSKSNIKKDLSNHKKNTTRSNSTLSSKEVDFQNWKRRKNYDPMKAAAEGKKKQVEKKLQPSQPSTQANSENRSPSPPVSLLRSASFHGTEGVMCNLRWARKPNNVQPQFMSEDDGPYSLEEEIGPHPSPRHGSPLHRSPTSPHQLCQSPIRHPPVRGRRPSLGHSDEGDSQFQTTLRKVSLDESGSEGKRSPLNSSTRGGSGNALPGAGRPKTKMEALDNLVISTIHSLSVKVRTTSESLLQKLKSQYDEEGDRAALLEEVLSHLSESDQSLTSGQTRSTSRELAGILRNLKKIEHALEVIDRVIIVGEEDYRDDDIDYVPTEWVEESDY